MRGRLGLAALVISTLWALAPRLEAQTQSQFFLSLTDLDGTFVGNLKVDDVKVTADGVECKILKVEPIDWPSDRPDTLPDGEHVLFSVAKNASASGCFSSSRCKSSGIAILLCPSYA